MNISGSLNSAGTGYFVNSFTAEEMVVETGGGNAESNNVGVMYDIIPKEGGNRFSGLGFGVFTHDSLQGNNLSDSLRDRGLTRVAQMDYFYDIDGTVGGPVAKDRLWFFTAHRKSQAKSFFPDIFYNSSQGTPFFVQDNSRPGFTQDSFRSSAVRLTWQASKRNKINGFAEFARGCTCPNRIGAAPQAAEALIDFSFSPHRLTQATWNSPVSNKLLLEAGVSAMIFTYSNRAPDRTDAFQIPILNQATGFRYNAANPAYPTGASQQTEIPRFAQRFSASYVTGSHQFKAGMSIEEGYQRIRSFPNDPIVGYNLLGTIPASIDQFAKPYAFEQSLNPDLGLYAQDQWIYRRLTLKLGLRFDYFHGSVPAQEVPAGPFTPARSFAAVDDVPNWKNVNPRFAASYDLLGNSRTALKVSFGRYNGPTGAFANALSFANNPVVTSVLQANRVWGDVNGDYVPDCDLANPLGNGECGQLSDLNFGRANPRATVYADDVLRGWHARDYSWDFSARVEHEFRRGISVSGGYFRNVLGNFSVTDNVAVTPADYTSFCINAPVDQRLPGGGGFPVCGLADVSPARFGLSTNVVKQASNFGKQTQVANFFNVNVNAQVGRALQMGGGLDTGRLLDDRCFTVDSPQEMLNCRVVQPLQANTQVKMFWTYRLPADVVFSGTLQNMPGPPVFANYVAPNAVVAPGLGRDLAACGTRRPCTATFAGIPQVGVSATAVGIPLIAPFTQFEGRRTQLNVRVGKMMRLPSNLRVQVNADVYNVLNRGDILSRNNTFGPIWGQPLSVLDARMLQLSADLRF